jgi:hypothetical protein
MNRGFAGFDDMGFYYAKQLSFFTFSVSAIYETCGTVFALKMSVKKYMPLTQRNL